VAVEGNNTFDRQLERNYTVEREEGIELEWVDNRKMVLETSGACMELHGAESVYADIATEGLHVTQGKVAPKKTVEGHSMAWGVPEVPCHTLRPGAQELDMTQIVARELREDAEL
jgi:hypothetical protein